MNDSDLSMAVDFDKRIIFIILVAEAWVGVVRCFYLFYARTVKH